MSKVCSKCQISKELTEFNNNKASLDGKHTICKECKKISDKNYRKDNIDKIQKRDRMYYENNADKIKERSREWYKENASTARELQNQYYKENYAKIKATQAKWNIANSDKIKEYMRQYVQTRSETDVNFRMRLNLRSRFRAYIKTGDFFEYLGCDIDFFKKWMEFQFGFDPKMTWQNNGAYWHYDHVIPCASYDLSQEDQIKECFHWSNIRPLEKAVNLRKKDKIMKDVIEQHKHTVEQFLQSYDVPSA